MVPPRKRNRLRLADGFAPIFAERQLNPPNMDAAMEAVRGVPRAYEAFPALAVVRHRRLMVAKEGLPPLHLGVAAQQLEPGVDVLNFSLSPGGLTLLILNLKQWRHHILEQPPQPWSQSSQCIRLEPST